MLVIPAIDIIKGQCVRLKQGDYTQKIIYDRDPARVAMEWEKLSEEFYADFARRAEDARGRTVLQYLSKMENSHYHLLKTERDLISQFPDYYKIEEFHFGDEMVHLGP